jgi:diguanylate cyclase (GGDEF)-like protein
MFSPDVTFINALYYRVYQGIIILKKESEKSAEKTLIYVLYIMLSCLLTSALNIVHSIYLLKIELKPVAFVIPLIAGVVFGIMLARIKILSRQMTAMAYTDSLTHIYNRLHFNHYLEMEVDRSKRYQVIFSVILFDLDHFKKINDKYGHQVGDRVLRQISQIVSTANRNVDIFARYGGEEFIILATTTRLDGARLHAERLRHDIERHDFKIGRAVTASFGVVEFNPELDNTSTLIRRADIALYQAKGKGRNCVVTG